MTEKRWRWRGVTETETRMKTKMKMKLKTKAKPEAAFAPPTGRREHEADDRRGRTRGSRRS